MIFEEYLIIKVKNHKHNCAIDDIKLTLNSTYKIF